MRSVSAVFVVLALSGCFGSSKPAPPVPANKADAPVSASPDDELAFLPIDAEIVVGIDMAALKQSALFPQLQQMITQGLGMKLGIAKQCGVDPFNSVQRAVVGGTISSNEKFTGVVAIRGADKTRFLDCMTTAAQNDNKTTVNAGVVTMKAGDDNHDVAATVVGTTLVFDIRPGATHDTLAAALSSGAPLRKSPAFMKLFERRERGAAVWGMVNGAASFLGPLRAMGLNPKTIDGTLTLTDRVSAAGRLSFVSQAEADDLVLKVNPMVPQAKQMIEQFTVRADGTMVRFDATATEQQIRMLAGMLGAAIP